MSAAPKMTPWFDPAVEPARIGVYQTEDLESCLDCPEHGYQHWNGSFWGTFSFTPEHAVLDADRASGFQRNYWRGLAEKP